MGSFQNFAQMLEKKIRREIELEARNSTFFPPETGETPSEPWTRLVGEMGPIQFQSSQKASVYHRQRPPRKPRPPHVLNEDQQWAWSFFQTRLEKPLEGNFSKAELGQAFRTLALRLHPDQGGSATQMRDLLRARRTLERVFN